MITDDDAGRAKAELARLPAVIADARLVVREACREQGLSIRAAAKQMALTPTTLARFVNGTTTPHVTTLLAVLTWITALPSAGVSPCD